MGRSYASSKKRRTENRLNAKYILFRSIENAVVETGIDLEDLHLVAKVCFKSVEAKRRLGFVWLMRTGGGLSYPQIASILGISIGRVRILAHKMERKLFRIGLGRCLACDHPCVDHKIDKCSSCSCPGYVGGRLSGRREFLES